MFSSGDDVSEELIVNHGTVALLFKLKSKQRTQFSGCRLIMLINLHIVQFNN